MRHLIYFTTTFGILLGSFGLLAGGAEDRVTFGFCLIVNLMIWLSNAKEDKS